MSCSAYSSKDKLVKWFEIGQEMLESELNIVRILRQLRAVAAISKNKWKQKIAVQFDRKNVIYLDSEDDDFHFGFKEESENS